MFPWNYGFHFGPASYIFLGAFYTVLIVVATTFVNALWRANRDLSKGKVEDIRWHSDFHDLSAADRTCRHKCADRGMGFEKPRLSLIRANSVDQTRIAQLAVLSVPVP